MTWTHKFVCLPDSAQDDVPGAADKHKLKCADLGEKKIVFLLDGKYADIKDALLHAYPALEKGGGFELMRTAGPYSRQLVPIDAKFTTLVAVLKQFIDQARIYIRLIQADLPLQEEDADKGENVRLNKIFLCLYFYKFAFYTIRRKAVWLRRNVWFVERW